MIKSRRKIGMPLNRYIHLAGFLFLALSMLFINSCGGGGAGGSSDPTGNSPGVPHTLLLYPDKTIAQTGTYVELHAKLMDGNGNPIPGETVNFTNKSVVGTLYAASTTPATTAVTDGKGVATILIRSTTPGFASVVAESYALRDFRSIYFTSNDIISGITFNPVSVFLEVDGNNNGIYDEPDDFVLFQGAGDDSVLVRATVYLFGEALPGASITFTADDPDASFPGGVDTNDDKIPDRKVSTTDSAGQAYATVKVEPTTITNASVVMNVQAATASIYVPEFDNYFSGAGLVSIFLEPVVIGQIDLYAAPTVVSVDGTSTLTIGVSLNTGTPAPDGTSVQLTTTCGAIDTPFVQTKDGNGSAKFTAPSTPGTCTVTATVGGVSDSVSITVNSDLQITGPTTISEVNGSAAFSVNGGTSPYSITFGRGAGDTNPIFTESSPFSGGSLTLTTNGDCTKITSDTSITVTVTDNVGATDSTTLTVTNEGGTTPGLCIIPAVASVDDTDGTNKTVTFTVYGDNPTFSACADTDDFTQTTATGICPTNFVTGLNSGDSFSLDTNTNLGGSPGVGNDTVTVTVTDGTDKVDATLTVVDN